MVSASRSALFLSTLILIPLCTQSKHIVELSPLNLLNGTRFDVMAKYIYAKHRELGVHSDWAPRLYEAHLRVWNNVHENYPPKHIPNFHCAQVYHEKNGIKEYIHYFDAILDSVKEEGLNTTKSVIPIDKNSILIDGAHRVAACLLYNQPVTCEILSNTHGHNASAHLLRHHTKYVKGGLAEKYLDNMALEYCNLKENTVIVTLFPSATGKEQEIQDILKRYGNIVYRKQFHLNKTGGDFFVRTLYHGERWVGTWRNRFSGAHAKAPYCFPQDERKKNPVRVYLLEVDRIDLKALKECKLTVRSLFNIGNDSIHINDTPQETLRIARTVFNANSIHFLNHCKLQHFARFEELLRDYSHWLKNVPAECYCIDGSAILSAYGIRDCNDFDILHHDGYELTAPHHLITSHNTEMKDHVYTKDDIIFNPERHFYYLGIKFASLDVITKMKEKRNEGKDRIDVAAVKELLATTH